MSLPRAIDRLLERIGLDPSALGASTIRSVVAARQKAAGFATPVEYAQLLDSSPTEVETLIDALVVSETWFFRGGDLFECLAKHIRDLAATRGAGVPVRVLSVPCSSGEEPYSLAIALTELSVPRDNWTITAIDISHHNLERAQLAQFGQLAFRQIDPALRERYFHPQENQWRLDDRVRGTVDFRHGNLLDPHFLHSEAPYDLILFRNLFIYLRPEVRERVLATLEQLLTPSGLICVGHAEPLNAFANRFATVGEQRHFLYRRVGESTPTAPAKTRSRPPRASHPKNRPTSRLDKSQSSIAVRNNPTPVTLPLAGIARARQLADAGDFAAVLVACESCLATDGPTAELYCLMGVAHQRLGQEAAAKRCFEKVLYLEPDHHEALLALLLVSERLGAAEQVTLLRRRLQRVAARGDA